jgi:hypothetical protein
MNVLVYVIVLFVILIMVVAAARWRIFQFRPIAAYSALPMLVGEAVESDKTVHVSFGSSAVRDSTTLTALATAEILYHVAERSSLADKPSVVTVSDPITLGLGQDTLRRAYKARGRLAKYRSTMARWYPQGPQSLAFAAGAGETILDEDASLNVMVGRFGPEMMLAAENAIRYNRLLITQSDQVEGQAVAYAVSETPLIGEELYVGGAYLSESPLQIGGVLAQDVLRYIVIATIIGLAILSIAGTNF